MYSVSSNAVAESVDKTKSDILELVMWPRVGGGTQSFSQFSAELVHNNRAPASCGSINLTDGPIGNSWYNFIYIPHRNGIGGDNYQYGTLLLTTMTSNSAAIWMNHLISGVWYGWIGNG